MIRLKDFISPLHWHLEEGLSQDAMDLLGYRPDSILDTNIYIEETLIKSYDIEGLFIKVKKILKSLERYEVVSDKTKEDDVKSVVFVFKDIKEAQELYNPTSENLKSLLRFYNYKASTKKGNLVLIEPVYSKKVNSLVSKNHYVLWHVCMRGKVDSIMKKGLVCKNNMSREIPSRIYLFSSYDLYKDKEEFRKFFKELSYNKDDCYLLRIRLPNEETKYSRYDFYQDDLMKSKRTVWTYNNISPKYIEKKDINKYL